LCHAITATTAKSAGGVRIRMAKKNDSFSIFTIIEMTKLTIIKTPAAIDQESKS
jgi:hypothetical protein